MTGTTLIATAAAISLLPMAVLAGGQKATYKPKEGYVPDAATAIRIAVAVWIPIYGEDEIAKQKPYVAILSNGVWTVEGSLPDGWKGGVAEADISKDDGRILRVMHGE